MEINAFQTADLASIRQALGMANMRKAMKQDAETVSTLLQGMQETSDKAIELSATPYKGSNIDIRI